jgi:predicted transcriptional regulator
MKKYSNVLDYLLRSNRPKTFLELVLLTDKAKEGVRREIIGLLKRGMVKRVEITVREGRRPLILYEIIKKKG